mgnify:FL=1
MTILELLQSIEWEGDPVHHVCPSCQQMKMVGHAKGCELLHAIEFARAPFVPYEARVVVPALDHRTNAELLAMIEIGRAHV